MNLPKSKPGMMVQGKKGAENILLWIDGETHSVNRNTCPKFDEIIEAFNNEEYDLIPALISAREALSNFLSNTGNSKVEFSDEHITLNGEQLASGLEKLLLRMYYAGAPMHPYIEMLERLDNVHSMTVRKELLLFMDASDLQITPDGMLYAWRAVKVHTGADLMSANGYIITKGDFVDIRTGEWRNNVGDICEMKRNQVNENRGQTCEAGLHFASQHYAQHSYGNGTSALIMVEIDPAHVVTIPNDYSNQKGRCHKFKVIACTRNPNSDGVVNERALGKAVLSNKELQSLTQRWQVRERDTDKVVNTFKSRAPAIAARKKGPGLYGYDILNSKRF